MKTKLTLFIAVIAVALFGMGCASTEPAFVSDGLVAYYPFNGNAKDESGNGNDGEVMGAKLAVDRHGQNGKAFAFFEPASRIEISDHHSLRPKHITTSAWWYLDSALKAGAVIIVKARRGDAHGEQFFLSGFSTKKDGPVFQIKRESKGVPGRGWKHVTSKLKQEPKKWIHIIGTWDGKLLKIYINGVMTGEIEHLPGAIDNVEGGSLIIGRGHNSTSDYERHKIDDIRIYNRALSAEEVKALYDLEKPKTK